MDTVQIGDVWYLAAQYEQHRNRRRHAQQQQQQQERQDGMANGRSATPPSHAAAEQQQQQPLAKRARHDTHQQQQLGTSTSPPPDRQSTAAGDGANAGTPKGAGKRGSDAGHKQQQQRDKHAGEKTGAGSSRQPGTTSPTQASAAAAAAARGAGGDAAGGELVLRPYKLGPAPDKLQQLWDDIAKVNIAPGVGGGVGAHTVALYGHPAAEPVLPVCLCHLSGAGCVCCSAGAGTDVWLAGQPVDACWCCVTLQHSNPSGLNHAKGVTTRGRRALCSVRFPAVCHAGSLVTALARVVVFLQKQP